MLSIPSSPAVYALLLFSSSLHFPLKTLGVLPRFPPLSLASSALRFRDARQCTGLNAAGSAEAPSWMTS